MEHWWVVVRTIVVEAPASGGRMCADFVLSSVVRERAVSVELERAPLRRPLYLFAP